MDIICTISINSRVLPDQVFSLDPDQAGYPENEHRIRKAPIVCILTPPPFNSNCCSQDKKIVYADMPK